MQPSKGNHIAGTFQLTFLVKHVSKDQKYDCDNAVQSDQQASAHMNLFQCGKIFIHGPGQGYVIQQIHKWRKYRVSGLCQPITYLITKDSHAITHGGNDQCGNGFNSNIQKISYKIVSCSGNRMPSEHTAEHRKSIKQKTHAYHIKQPVQQIFHGRNIIDNADQQVQ